MITQAHPETHRIMNSLRAAYDAGKISKEQWNEIVIACLRAETEWQVLGKYVAPSVDLDAGCVD